MSIDRMKSLRLAVLVGALGLSVALPHAYAQETPKPAAKEAPKPASKDSTEPTAQKKPEAEKKDQAEQTKAPVEETKPSEQTQDAANGVTVPEYRDDRSSPQALIESYYNAINRKEYTRAYGYYSEEGREPDFKTFVKGYENTKSVKVALRKTEPDPGAGQIYWSQPLAIEAESNDGKKEVFGGCYTIHLTNPAMQEEPPFKPIEIMTGSLSKSELELEKSVPEACEAP
ncbi:hypothetical protein [Brucella haematophila]|uniref:Uncharacterized protein n=1 Tax=Brucella haematophila TaxID=419474 RepID=A0ABX1DN76_9HYPH|nr:hypothetical protein [Brucella haematophila]NKC02747.1 hypothetical protein [Brucella haematophila]TMU92175.1 hypothetical protein FGI60_20510 [Brucella haematophila]